MKTIAEKARAPEKDAKDIVASLLKDDSQLGREKLTWINSIRRKGCAETDESFQSRALMSLRDEELICSHNPPSCLGDDDPLIYVLTDKGEEVSKLLVLESRRRK